MKVIITGMNGTVAPVVAQYLKDKEFEIVAWDRDKVSTTNEGEMRNFIREVKPDWFFHIGMGSPEFGESLARICMEESIQFLFTSTVSVYSEQGTGPYNIECIPNSEEDYGRYKRECEERIRYGNPNAYIVRIGWQIGRQSGSNNMFDFLTRTMEQEGKIEASEYWYPSCSFLEDTAEALYDIMKEHSPGVYLMNGNEGYNFFEIVEGINRMHGNPWTVIKGQSFKRDDRMFDLRVKIRSIRERLSL